MANVEITRETAAKVLEVVDRGLVRVAANTNTHNPRKPKTNAELVGMINRYWGQPVARVVRAMDDKPTPGKGHVSYETIASSTLNGLPIGVTRLPRRA